MEKHRIYSMSVSSVYPHYIAKVKRKGQDVGGVDEIITWLTGYSKKDIDRILDDETNFEAFFASAPNLNPSRHQISGSICGVKIQEIQDPLMKEVRYLDKLIDELAQGRPMSKIFRTNA